MFEKAFVPVGKEIITGSDQAETLTLPEGGNVDAARITVEGGDARYWLDGSTPTVSEGHLLSDGAGVTFTGVNLANMEIYVPSGVTLMVSYLA